MSFQHFAKFLALFLLACLFAAPVRAEVPDDMVNKDFASCMGNATPASDPERAQYCNCIRDGLRKWDLNAYGETALEQSKAGNAQQVPAQLSALASECIHKVLK
jgi:hypothetical protein